MRCGVSALVRNARAWCRHVARGRTTRDYKAVPSSPLLSSTPPSPSLSTRGCPFYNFLREFLINGRRRVNRACAWAPAMCAVHALLLLHRACVVFTLRRHSWCETRRLPPSPSVTHLRRCSFIINLPLHTTLRLCRIHTSYGITIITSIGNNKDSHFLTQAGTIMTYIDWNSWRSSRDVAT